MKGNEQTHLTPPVPQPAPQNAGRARTRRIRAALRKVLISCLVILLLAAIGYYSIRWSVRRSAPESLRQAEHYLSQRQNERARETLAWLLFFEPAHDKALLITGVSLNADKRFPEAIEILDGIPESSEIYDQAGIAMASSLIHDDQFERAERVLKRYLEQFPEAHDARESLVRLYLKELRQREAMSLLLERLRLFPNETDVLPQLLELEANQVPPHDAVPFLEAADAKHPQQAPVVLGLAYGYSLTGMKEPARTRFASAIKLRPEDPFTRILAAEFFLDCGEPETARGLLGLDSALKARAVFAEDFPDDRYWFLRCRVLEEAGDANAAYAQLRKALKLRAYDETYLFMQSKLLRRMGRVEEAMGASKQAAQLAMDRKQLKILLNKLDRNQPDPALCFQIGQLMERLGRLEQAGSWRRVGQALSQVQSVDSPPASSRPAIEYSIP